MGKYALLCWDGGSGAAGDMLLASLIDAGADPEALKAALRALPLGDWAITVEKVKRGGIASTYVEVHDTAAETGDGDRRLGNREHDPKDRSPAPNHDHDHDHGRDHALGHGHGPHRHLSDLLALARHPSLPERVQARAEKVFRALAEAEARVHGTTPEEVHFHEISGLDTAIDVLGVCLALEQLAVDVIVAAPPRVGSGIVRTAHGEMPVPAPATAEILRAAGRPFRPGGAGELLTPTGAALLTVLAGSAEEQGFPDMATERIGYGAGRKDPPGIPNVVRARLLRPQAVPSESVDWSEVFTAVIDDATPEAAGFLAERLREAGAFEVYWTPVHMKKGRPGFELTAMCAPSGREGVEKALREGGTTFGWRIRTEMRHILARRSETVAVAGHPVRIKLGLDGRRIVRRQPEYEDCRAAALALGIPLDEVFHQARRAAETLS